MNINRIIRGPHVSEKSHEYQEAKNTYVFRVEPSASKTAIRTAVEKIWNVKVISVRTVNVAPKPRRFGRFSGYTSGYKKAIVRLAEGCAIDDLR
ncbi:MAG: 50S ribosomal protein L23 [Planctomycetota bacterium]|nr:50S ribosomal protein L23 [Planctomycetota bacterium]